MVGNLVFNWSQVPLDNFQTKKVKGKKQYRVCWTYKILLGAKEGLLQVQAEIAGREIGTVEFDFGKLENGTAKL